jgi:hypothetical protein
VDNTRVAQIRARAVVEWGTVAFVLSACALLTAHVGRGWLWSF